MLRGGVEAHGKEDCDRYAQTIRCSTRKLPEDLQRTYHDESAIKPLNIGAA